MLGCFLNMYILWCKFQSKMLIFGILFVFILIDSVLFLCRPFVCKSCGASFKTKANLLNHQPTHTGEKKYFCELCGQQFAHKTSLTLHYRWHTGES
jgi:uncharacterized Zn-finger protein